MQIKRAQQEPFFYAGLSTARRDDALTGQPDSALSLYDVDENKQTNPNHIDKVPIPTGRLEAKAIFGGEVALYCSN